MKDDARSQDERMLDRVSLEMEPPPELEAKVQRALVERGLIRMSSAGSRSRLGRVLLAAAAAALFAVGVLVGRTTSPSPDPAASAPDGATRYALLLYEGDTYQPPAAAEDELALYRDYSVWVREARRRRQFVTGEDLAVDRAVTVSPEGLTTTEERESAPSPGILSGMFVITATSFESAQSLAESLPHVRRGGHVVIQKILPTDQPPPVPGDVEP